MASSNCSRNKQHLSLDRIGKGMTLSHNVYIFGVRMFGVVAWLLRVEVALLGLLIGLMLEKEVVTFFWSLASLLHPVKSPPYCALSCDSHLIFVTH